MGITVKEIKAKADRAGYLKAQIDEMGSELKILKSELKDIGAEKGVKSIEGSKYTACFMSRSTSYISNKVVWEVVAKRKISKFMELVNPVITNIKKEIGENKFGRVAVVETNKYGSITFKALKSKRTKRSRSRRLDI